MRGSSAHTIASVTVSVSCRAPTAWAISAASERSSAAPGTSNPAVKASTGWSFSRAIIASTAELSIPLDRNMP